MDKEKKPLYKFKRARNKNKKKRGFPVIKGKVPIRLLVPNFITLMALCAGLTAIRMAMEHRFDMAIYVILIAAFLDGIDGRVARFLNASSRFGAELDSLADFVNFGVVPGLVLFIWTLQEADHRSLGWIVVLIFAMSMILRLARFNTMLDAPNQPRWKSNYFVGVPAPAGAFLVLFPLYLDQLQLPFLNVKEAYPVVMVYMLLISFLLISRIPTFSGKLLGEKISGEYIAPLFVLLGLIAAILFTYTFAVLAIGVALYLVSIFFSISRYKVLERAHKKKKSLVQE